MQFTPVSREDIPKVSKRESAVSGVLFREFLDSGAELAKIEIGEGDKKLASVRSTLQNYVKRHELAVNVFTRGSDLYLERLTPEQLAEKQAKEAERELAKANETPAEDAELANA